MPNTPILYDPSTPELQIELWNMYRTMRDEYPVYHDPGCGFYALTRFADVWAAAADCTTQAGLTGLHRTTGSQHGRRYPELHPESLIDTIAANVTCEFQHDYAAVIPSEVVGGMIGLDEQHIGPVRAWTEAFIDTTDTNPGRQ